MEEKEERGGGREEEEVEEGGGGGGVGGVGLVSWARWLEFPSHQVQYFELKRLFLITLL